MSRPKTVENYTPWHNGVASQWISRLASSWREFVHFANIVYYQGKYFGQHLSNEGTEPRTTGQL
jgi:hypothetical protein